MEELMVSVTRTRPGRKWSARRADSSNGCSDGQCKREKEGQEHPLNFYCKRGNLLLYCTDHLSKMHVSAREVSTVGKKFHVQK